jgi:acyl-CoA dehydrogenase
LTEVFAKYGTPAQKEKWLKPLLDGKIRSAFAMTEPRVASSDATNIETSIRRVGNEYVINGLKWWISGAGDPRCAVYLLMGKTDPDNKNKHRQQSIVIIPADAPGITVIRPMKVFGYDDAPEGHCEILFKDVRVPVENIILGEGRGFEVIQGRLGPGRIHHCMRCIGMAERGLDLMLARTTDPTRRPFGTTIAAHETVIADIAASRIDIDQARFLVLSAARKIDQVKAKGAMKEISMAKIVAPNMVLRVLDRAMQSFGAMGISQDTPLAHFYASARTLRYADGPDHMSSFQQVKIIVESLILTYFSIFYRSTLLKRVKLNFDALKPCLPRSRNKKRKPSFLFPKQRSNQQTCVYIISFFFTLKSLSSSLSL